MLSKRPADGLRRQGEKEIGRFPFCQAIGHPSLNHKQAEAILFFHVTGRDRLDELGKPLWQPRCLLDGYLSLIRLPLMPKRPLSSRITEALVGNSLGLE